ncbi:hypothetical protein MDOR_07460 [Mycolicibacterium doricum]|uniref:Oxidoreductase N-terminal domain-containing protein n=2 Tax=Mycolicibacterium doricum TaxID=126673 RepID=A0A7I7VNY6_9MYCO|nr:hypothetical protein MDOR_07460 [Mycolicibacterium doricum]
MRTNRKWVLARRPTGIVDRDDFEWREEPAPTIDGGQFLVRNRWLSCDAAQRSWMEFDTYIPALPPGGVMASVSVGEVVESNHPGFRVGEYLSGAFGWQDYAVSDGTAFGGLLPPVAIPPGVRAHGRAVPLRHHRSHRIFRSTGCRHACTGGNGRRLRRCRGGGITRVPDRRAQGLSRRGHRGWAPKMWLGP